MGCLVAVHVHAANIHDSKSGFTVAERAFKKCPTIAAFCADMGYRGEFVRDVVEKLGLRVDISEKIKPHEWERLPWRWVVERTFGWMNSQRRLSKDFETSISSVESMVMLANIATLAKRL